eukprot:TRINITY_DN3030_c0_g1_i1.p1 TRINITY_DN3030_c0_g1~~TRINITY_DN3030_c0_g1_i1.p1  ORF type:complete len:568 (-),score=87.55 TRINITY_DN3030_c0_g1_i1:29-1732(-)
MSYPKELIQRLEGVSSVGSSVTTPSLVISRARLHELFGQIEREFEVLWEENQELKSRLGIPPTMMVGPPSPLPQRKGMSEFSKSMGVGKLKIKIPKQMKPGPKRVIPKWAKVKEFLAHRDGIWEVSACPWDVNSFVTASADHSARVWAADGTRSSVVYFGHTGSVNSARYHPSDRLVCTASGDRSCHIWKIPLPEKLTPSMPSRSVSSSVGNTPSLSSTPGSLPPPVALSPYPVTTTKLSSTPKPWNPLMASDHSVASTPSINITPIPASLASPISSPPINFSSLHSTHSILGTSPPHEPLSGPDDEPVHSHPSPTIHAETVPPATGTTHPTTGLPQTTQQVVVRTPLVELKGHTAPVVCAGWASASTVATASWDHTVRIWSADSGRATAMIPAGHNDKVHRITYLSTSPAGGSPMVAYSSTDGHFRLWDTRTASSTPTEPAAPHQDVVTSVIFSNNGGLLISGSDDRTVKVWDARNLRQATSTIRCSSGVNRLGISHLTNTLVVPLDDRHTLVYDTAGNIKGKLQHQGKLGHKMMVGSAVWSADESVIFTTGFDRRVLAWARDTSF